MKASLSKIRIKRWIGALKSGRLSFLGSFGCLAAHRWRQLAGAVIVLLVIISLVALPFFNNSVSAQTYTLGADQLKKGYANYGDIYTSHDGTIRLQDGEAGEWHGHNGMPQLQTRSGQYYDKELVARDDQLYLMGYGANCRFEMYDQTYEKWTELPPPPESCAADGLSLSFDGESTIYYLPAGGSVHFYAYDIEMATWRKLADALMPINDRADMTYVGVDGGRLYAIRGGGSAIMLMYSVDSDSWQQVASYPYASTLTYGAYLAWDGNNAIYGLNGRTGQFERYDILTDMWQERSRPISTSMYTSILLAKGLIYSLQVRSDSFYLYQYDPATDVWTELPYAMHSQFEDYSPPFAFDGDDGLYTVPGYARSYYVLRYSISQQDWGNEYRLGVGADVDNIHNGPPIYDGGQYAYYAGGASEFALDYLYRLDLATGETVQLGVNPPFGQVDVGSAGVYMNNALYMAAHPGYYTFAKYDLATSQWIELPDLPLAAGDGGMGMVDGGDGYIYSTFGRGSTGFYRFSDAGGWEQMPSMPFGTNYAYSPMTKIGGHLYVLTGDNHPRIMRYDIDAAQWISLDGQTFTPNGSISYGSTMISDGQDYLYVIPSDNKWSTSRLFYRYNIHSNTWKRLADLPASVKRGAGGFYDASAERLYLLPGNGLPYLWYWTPLTSEYVSHGTWYSDTLDLAQVQSWTGINITASSSEQVKVYTRSSDSGRLWSGWQEAVGSIPSSPLKRYWQIRVDLDGDGSSTPELSQIELDYEQETDPPSLPSQLVTYSQKDGVVLESGETYEYQHPYFEWQGASDGQNGSGIKGYHVYFGTDSNADPSVNGSFQQESNYTVTTAMSAGSVHYLRIMVEDNLGNLSQAATYFSYRYWYISPPASVLESTQADFSEAENVQVDLDALDGSMRLRQQEGGAWATGAMSMLPDASWGGASIVIGDYLYILKGVRTPTFWRYDMNSQIWDELVDAPGNIYEGSGIAWDGDKFLYILAGDVSRNFYRYDLSTATWGILPELPLPANRGSDLAYIGNGQLALIFPNVTEFYTYNIASQEFEVRSPMPESFNSTYTGAGLWYDGRGKLYAYLGGNGLIGRTMRKSFALYDVASDSWSTLAQPPANSYYPENNLAYDGQGNLYIFGNPYFFGSSEKSMASKYNIASDSWESLPEFNISMSRGTIASDEERYIYVIPSITTSDTRLVRYDTWENKLSLVGREIGYYQSLSWDDQDKNRWSVENGTSAAFDGNDIIYATGSGASRFSNFIAYSVSTGETEYLPPPPHIGNNGSLTYSNGYIYYLTAYNSTYFYRYDIVARQWERMAEYPETVDRAGSTTLIVDKDGNLYGFEGVNSQSFYRYTPDGSIGSWSQLASTPGYIQHGAAIYDNENYIYVLRGAYTDEFYRYDIAADSWSQLAGYPTGRIEYGESMVIHEGKIYASAGNDRHELYIYDIANDSWSPGPDAPEPFESGTLMIKVDSQRALAFSHASPGLWQFNFPSDNTAYRGAATHVSQPVEIDGLYDYATIKAEVDIPENTNVELWTRTSVDGQNWDDWQIVKEIKHYDGQMSARVMSVPQRFTQVKVVMESFDNLYTPTVGSYALDYYFDVDPPENPTVVEQFSDSTKQNAIQNNTWYNHDQPFFDWPDPGQAGGATDGPIGSNLAGYWVYFGMDETALPQTAGVFVEPTEYQASLSDPGTYYLRIQAQDKAGNIDPEVFAPFIYKFDNVAPDNPPLISANPSGFTSTNNFSFEWPSASDAHSGVDVYCYRTGAATGPFSDEVCTEDLHIADVSAAYRQGTNVFYVRTRDAAGNFATYSAQVSFYYSTAPPQPVQNLRAIPPVSAQNLFAFTWDLPVLFSGDASRLSYCFSINELPSALNTTCVAEKFIPAFKAATQQGTNILYMVAKDEANNVNWTNYASANFIANTVSPGIPLNLSMTDSSDRSSDRWSLTATWNKPTFEGNGVDHYIVERSVNNHTYESIGTVSTTAFVDMTVEPEQTYYYRVRASDNIGNTGGASGVVSQKALGRFVEPPEIVSQPVARSGFDQAEISWVTSRPSTSFVYYGTAPNDLQQSKGDLEDATEHKVTITGLTASTVYYFKVQSFDQERNYSLEDTYSQIFTFRTAENARIYGVSTSDVSLATAMIHWQTSVPTKAKIEYGPSTDYGFHQENVEVTSTNHFIRLTSLQSGTTYHYRVVATTDFGSIVYSDDYTFTTIPLPLVSNVRFQPIQDSATIAVAVTWDTNVPTDSSVTYSAQGLSKEVATTDLKTSHRIELFDLAGSADYLVSIKGRDAFGNIARADNQRWTSQIDTRSPSIREVAVDVASMGAWGDAKAQMIISWQTDEPSSSQVEYRLANQDKTVITTLDPEPKTNHVVVISNLDLAHIYRIKPVSRDISGNTTYGQEVTAVTPDSQSSLLDIILRTLQTLLGQS